MAVKRMKNGKKFMVWLLAAVMMISCAAMGETAEDSEIEEILNRMTLEEKAGQMMIVSFRLWKEIPEENNEESATVEIATAQKTAFAYEHDPRDNPKAMKDIVVNPEAVYGFSPNPESVRLKDYVDFIDWTDPVQVAEARAQRQVYHESMSELYRMIENMLLETKTVEDIARAVSRRRNELRLEAYADDPEGLALAKKSNLETYGDEMGPSADFLYEKYGSWQTVLEKALGTNAGMDACLGFYDEYYDLYDTELLSEE